MIYTSTLADYLARINNGSKACVVRLTVRRTKLTLRLTELLYKNGVIRGMAVKESEIEIFPKYYKDRRSPRFILISRPGRKMHLSLALLTYLFTKTSVSNLYVVSTDKGLATSQECILHLRKGGEVLFKVVF